jgi:hypothetical protein
MLVLSSQLEEDDNTSQLGYLVSVWVMSVLLVVGCLLFVGGVVLSVKTTPLITAFTI